MDEAVFGAKSPKLRRLGGEEMEVDKREKERVGACAVGWPDWQRDSLGPSTSCQL